MHLPLISTILLLGILAVPLINSHLLFGKKLLLAKKLLGEKEDCHVVYEDKITPHCSTTFEQVGHSIPVLLKQVSFSSWLTFKIFLNYFIFCNHPPFLFQQCVDSSSEECHTSYTNSCVEETQKQCQTEHFQDCRTEDRQSCKTEQDSLCETNYEEECRTELRERCTQV